MEVYSWEIIELYLWIFQRNMVDERRLNDGYFKILNRRTRYDGSERGVSENDGAE
jgi:hypothetical protein